ncbi:hypothetical protein D3C80_642930 [compost metagenome]
MVGFGQQAIADIVEQGDEGPHQQEGFEEQPRQSCIAKVQREAFQQAARVQGARTEVA